MGIFTCIPAMMYHHVNPQPEDSISITPENFETQIRYLSDSGYRSLHLPEFFDLIKGWSIPGKQLLITFDDGYADNLIYAYPILKKYKMKATIFPVTSFIKDSADRSAFKPTNDFELLTKTPFAKGGLDDFLSWEEMRRMMSEGLIDFQAHTHTHAAYFETREIIGFYDGSQNTKLAWATDGDIRLGIPIYETGPSLCARRYYDDRVLRDELSTIVRKNGGSEFMARQEAKRILSDHVKDHGRLNGRLETDKEQDERIMGELCITKGMIEEKLGKKVEYICWPWGSVDSPLMKRARRAGFIGGIGMKGGANMRLTNVMDIHRFNPCRKDIPALKQKLYKHSNLFFSLYNDKRIDNLLINRKRFE